MSITYCTLHIISELYIYVIYIIVHYVCSEGIQPCNMKNRDIY